VGVGGVSERLSIGIATAGRGVDDSEDERVGEVPEAAADRRG
jgi:hypothetical protein